jgi:hypothetical protein
MNWQKILTPVLVVAVLFVAWNSYGWLGLAFAGTALVMWLLLHFNRIVHVMKKAADRPKGYVGSAVMLNARLKPGVNLLHVMAMTESLGEARSSDGAQPEIYRWTDGTQSSVTCEFMNGKLVKWELFRPEAPVDEPPTPAP